MNNIPTIKLILLTSLLNLVHCAPKVKNPSAINNSPVKQVVKEFVLTPSGGMWDYSNGKLRWEGPLFIASGATLALSAKYLFDETPQDPFWVGSSKIVGDIAEIGGVTMPLWMLGSAYFFPKGSSQREKQLKVTKEMSNALIWTIITTASLKYLFSRQSPDQAEDTSFPSGHVAVWFAPAAVMAMEYPWWVGTLAMLFGSYVMATRVMVKSHYPSDVIAGAGIGSFFGFSSVLLNRSLYKK